MPEMDVCDGCGEPLGSRYRVFDRHRLMHTRCLPWETQPWPFAWQLKRLRVSWKAAGRADRARIAEVGVWLRRARAQWPRDATAVALELEQRLDDLGPLYRA